MKRHSNKKRKGRRSLRMKGYDYRLSGAYFVTICIQDGQKALGNISGGELLVNAAGQMVEREWLALAVRYPSIELDSYVIMPNHMHGILFLSDANIVDNNMTQSNVESKYKNSIIPYASRSAPPELGQVIGAYKSMTTVEYIRGVKEKGWEPFKRRLWQRNFYEHIIRSDRALDAIRLYIEDNPACWHEDKYFVDDTGGWRA